jgi:iron complex transport system permease protein
VGQRDGIDQLVLLELRLPRVIAALMTGACLAAAGWIFQRMSRNALASPDIIGLTTGSATGGLTVILLLGQSASSVAFGTLAGGLLTIALVYALSIRRGIGGQWMILAGIAVAAMLAAVNDYLLTRADLDEAVVARTWLFGSLQGTGWSQALTLSVIGICLLVLAGLQARRLDLLEMGDDVAAALGLPVARAKQYLLLVAVMLTALVIAIAGPIGFIALVAPQLARRLCGGESHFTVVMLCGGVLCVLSDVIARVALAPFQLPVGLITSLFGGAYLAWLLAREWRQHG